jgi:hypothetical protein
MMTLFTALFGGIGWRGWLALAAGLALITAILMVREADREAGATQERARIERANDEAAAKADKAEREVMGCRGVWNREASRCEQ